MGYPREPLSGTPMAGRGARRRARGHGRRFLGLSGILLAILAILYLLRPWPNSTAGDLVIPISLPPGPQFWIVLILFLAQLVVAYLYIRERGRLQTALSRRSAPASEEREAEGEPELRPHRPIPEDPVEYVEVPEEEAEDPVDYVPDDRPMPSVAAAEGR